MIKKIQKQNIKIKLLLKIKLIYTFIQLKYIYCIQLKLSQQFLREMA